MARKLITLHQTAVDYGVDEEAAGHDVETWRQVEYQLLRVLAEFAKNPGMVFNHASIEHVLFLSNRMRRQIDAVAEVRRRWMNVAKIDVAVAGRTHR